jgi:DNA-binding MarR family transcriptional regulator
MDKELTILEQIQNNPQIKQRDLASVAKASLGMTNAILKRFTEKGFITIKKVNNRNIRYALTAEGIDEINRKSWIYFKRTIKNVVVYQDALNEILIQVQKDNYNGVLLIGDSDLAFIIEHLCYKHKIEYKTSSAIINKKQGKWFQFLSENHKGECDNSKSYFLLESLILN